MANSMHAQAPWSLHNDNFISSLVVRPTGTTLNDIVKIADINKGRVDWEANVRLIAASPAMFDYISKRADQGDEEAKSILEAIHE